ncbi:MAG: daunorubicin resistance protein DrrA family ABC transporter ATP-binding protein [Acidimicrobiia bacterium]|nr:MAG: daunorubicin resistance protein DrrA family ABC transporter ATP-binding protein [Acidimicrobiia bacterium]
MTTRRAAIEVEGVRHRFGDVTALDGVDLRVAEGGVFGLLGPNGAGKTTLVRVLTTLLRPTEGRARVLGFDVVDDAVHLRSLIGLAGQYAAVDEALTGKENVDMVARLYNLKRAEAKRRTAEVLERIGLSDAADRPVRTYSGGMRRRLDLAASLVGKPQVLVMDEPTSGLDPASRIDLWEIIEELVAEGTTLLLTTQYLEEADRLADRIAVIDHGKVITEGTPDDLKDQLGGDVLGMTLESRGDLARATELLKEIRIGEPVVDDITATISLTVGDDTRRTISALRILEDNAITLKDLTLHRPSLDDVFLTLTGHKAEVEALNGNRARARRRVRQESRT